MQLLVNENQWPMPFITNTPGNMLNNVTLQSNKSLWLVNYLNSLSIFRWGKLLILDPGCKYVEMTKAQSILLCWYDQLVVYVYSLFNIRHLITCGEALDTYTLKSFVFVQCLHFSSIQVISNKKKYLSYFILDFNMGMYCCCVSRSLLLFCLLGFFYFILFF